jgi:RHS repeat-associated protein
VFHITDHLGNVRVTFTEGGVPNSSGIDILSYADYYAFGGQLPGRVWSVEASRFAYQSKEKAQDGTNWDQFALRSYNHDLGRWFAPDPYGQFASPYLSMGNNPVSFTDPDGGQIINGRGSAVMSNNFSPKSPFYTPGALNFYNADVSGDDIAMFEVMAHDFEGDARGTVCMGGDPRNPPGTKSLIDIMEAKYSAFVETMSFEGNSDDLRYNNQTKSYEVDVYVPTPAVFDHETGVVFEGADLVTLRFDGKDNLTGASSANEGSGLKGWEVADGFGQLANAGGVFYGGAELLLQLTRQNQGAKEIGRAIGFGTQRVAEALKGTLERVSKVSKWLGVAGYGLQLATTVYKYADGQKVSTSEKVGLSVSTGFVAAGIIAAGTVAAPFVAAGALIYGAAELGSWLFTQQTVEDHFFSQPSAPIKP